MSISAFELYHRTIDFLRLRKRAYQLAFPNPESSEVLKDLARFCRANVSCFDPDPRKHALAEGRREVWLRIMQHLNLTEDALWRAYGGPITKTQE